MRNDFSTISLRISYFVTLDLVADLLWRPDFFLLESVMMLRSIDLESDLLLSWSDLMDVSRSLFFFPADLERVWRKDDRTSEESWFLILDFDPLESLT